MIRDQANLPAMMYADAAGNIYDHPYYRMAGFSGNEPAAVTNGDLLPLPEFSKLFFLPGCPPVGLDPKTGKQVMVPEAETDRVVKIWSDTRLS
ncbi:MAG: hypothetical protein P8Y00_02510 [Deltaproteobacteria bacterium]